MAFDYGLRHIGIAIGQSMTGQARGVATVQAKEGTPAWRDIKRLVQEYAPGSLVVGEPLHMDGEPSDMSMYATRFAQGLKDRYKLPTTMADERLTSRLAHELLEDAIALGTARTIHEVSACLIAEQYLRDLNP
ncbi:MAG: Holliday junction resolvase RuvX [Pseudomonadota bacterium]